MIRKFLFCSVRPAGAASRKRSHLLLPILVLTILAFSGCAKSADITSGAETESPLLLQETESSPLSQETEVPPSSMEVLSPSTEESPAMTETPSGAEPTSAAGGSSMTESSATGGSSEAEPSSATGVPSGTDPTSATGVPSETEPTSTAGGSSVTEPTSAAGVSSVAEFPLTIDDIVFVGDSRTLSMTSSGGLEYRLLPDSAVFATWGGELTQESAKENALAAAAADRKLAVFWYGINDVQSDPEQKNAPQFRANYEAVIDLYQNTNPDSDIVILSILTTSVNEKDYYDGQEENIRAYNAELAALCEEGGYRYLDITGLFTGDECLAVGDYIHFSKEWYETKFIPMVLGALGVE